MKTAYSYVRFSTPQQEMGDSERRQLALAEAYCARNGLELSQEVTADRGVSAYHGKHRQNGALGRLLKTVKPGQAILIEDSDRWSRENPLDALTRLREVVQSGVEVHFLRTGQVVTRANFDDMAVIVPNFFGSLLANQESQKKSERNQAAWQKKKADALAGKPVFLPHYPCWLEWSKEQGKVTVNNAKAAVVKRLFRLASTGCGVLEIARALRDTPPITGRKSGVWCLTSIRRILRDKSAIGCYCPKQGEPVPGIYPAIVPDDLYYKVQAQFPALRLLKPRRDGNVNLLSGLVFCSRCGSAMTRAGGLRLICQGARQGRTDCGFSGVPLALVEKSLFEYLACGDCEQRLLGVEAAPSQVPELQGKLADAEKLAKKFVELIADDLEPSPLLYHRLKDEEARAGRLRTQIDLERQKAATPALDGYRELKILLDPRLREPEMVVSHVERDELVGPVLAGWAELKREVNRRLQDPESRPALRRAVNQIISRIDLDPQRDGDAWTYRISLPSGDWADMMVTKAGFSGYTALGNKELGQYWPPAKV